MALTKDPDAVLDYAFDWSAYLAVGETITTHEAVIESGDAVIDTTSQTTDTVVVWLSGGTLGTDVELRCRVTTSDGRIDDRSIFILIREASSACEPWPIVGYEPPEGLDADVLASAKSAAQMFLNGLTGRHFGTCTYNQRFQVRRRQSEACSPESWDSVTARLARDGECCAIKLPVSPVQSITEVRVDGVAIDPMSYTMVAGNRLIRTAGCWPSSGDDTPGRVEVTYIAGVPLGLGSKYRGLVGGAMGEVVREYVAAFTTGACKLPSRFVAVQRQGVSTQGLDPALFLNLGLTGLPLTDNLVRTVNPNGLRRKPRVVSIDGPRRY